MKYEKIRKLLEESSEKTAFINNKPTEYTDDRDLDKFKDNSDVKSIETADGKKIKEQEGVEFSVQETKSIAKEIGKALVLALREAGDEVDGAKIHQVEPNSFSIFVKYKNNFEDDFSFYIDGDTLHLQDFSFDKEIGEVGIKPSGEAIVHRDVIKNNMLKHFKAMNEDNGQFNDDDTYQKDIEVQADNEEEYQKLKNLKEEDSRQKYIRIFSIYKNAGPVKRREMKPLVMKAAKQAGIDLQLDN